MHYFGSYELLKRRKFHLIIAVVSANPCVVAGMPRLHEVVEMGVRVFGLDGQQRREEALTVLLGFMPRDRIIEKPIRGYKTVQGDETSIVGAANYRNLDIFRVDTYWMGKMLPLA